MNADPLLLGAIGGLVGTIGIIWRQLVHERGGFDDERRAYARIIFALLAMIARLRGEPAPPTISTPEKPNALEARALAAKVLNGDIEALLRDFLDGPPTKNERKKP